MFLFCIFGLWSDKKKENILRNKCRGVVSMLLLCTDPLSASRGGCEISLKNPTSATFWLTHFLRNHNQGEGFTGNISIIACLFLSWATLLKIWEQCGRKESSVLVTHWTWYMFWKKTSGLHHLRSVFGTSACPNCCLCDAKIGSCAMQTVEKDDSWLCTGVTTGWDGLVCACVWSCQLTKLLLQFQSQTADFAFAVGFDAFHRILQYLPNAVGTIKILFFALQPLSITPCRTCDLFIYFNRFKPILCVYIPSMYHQNVY